MQDLTLKLLISQFRLGEVESEWLDQMQFAAGSCDQPDRIAGIRGDARRIEHHAEHHGIFSACKYRFAAYYRQTYGRSPHTTLRN
jgi:hypothetical protein